MEAITLKNVSFHYVPGIPILRDFSSSITKGEFLTIVGPNGSGKSTLLKLCSGVCSARQGSIHLYGRPLSDYPRRELAKQMAFVSQENAIEFPFTVFEIVLMGRAPHFRGSAFESTRDREIARSVMDKTDIAHLAHQPVTTLSGGERQRAFIARALAQEPEIILLDEPNAHLDIAHQIEIFGLMKRLNVEDGMTVVAVSHDLNLAASYSDRIAMLLCGGLVAVGTPNEVLTSTRIREVFQTEVMVDKHPVRETPRITLAIPVEDGRADGRGSTAAIDVQKIG